jgi:hypothetical protein
MITNKLKTIFGLSIPLFIAHGIEEYLTGFYTLDRWDEWIFGLLPFTSIHQAMFATFQVTFWLILTISLLMLCGAKWQLRLLAVVGLVYVLELHHIVKALLALSYYPGLMTALVFPIIAFFFWREWFRNLKSQKYD